MSSNALKELMEGSSLQKTMRMEQFQIAFVHAMAAVYGWKVCVITPDDGIDLEISGFCLPSYQTILDDAKIEIQLKSTADLEKIESDSYNIKYKLDVKNYSQLISERTTVYRYLFVMDLPNNYMDWLLNEENSVKLQRKCYWISLRGWEPTDNTSSITIEIPKKNVLTPSVLNEIMYAAANYREYL